LFTFGLALKTRDVSLDSVCTDPFPETRLVVSIISFENWAIREALESVVKVMRGLLKLGLTDLLSGFCHPRNEYPGLGVAVITEDKVALLAFHSLRLVSLKICPPPMDDAVIFKSCNATIMGSKFAKTV
jgi:hypothetical protein